MDSSLFQAVESIIGRHYAPIAQQARQSRTSLLSNLLHQRRVPDVGWDDLSVHMLMDELAAMDLNNSLGVVGVGEREGRVYSRLVLERHFRMSHGVGRSGALLDLQPKAPGSSLLSKLTQYLVKDLLYHIGLKCISDCIVLPVATGMALVLCMSVLRSERPTARFVLWSRIDQKSCIKSICAAGFETVVVQLKRNDGGLVTDSETIENKIKELGPEKILCVLTTTSCFAPRIPDNIPAVGKICQQLDVPHIVNNAYGLQCSKCVHLIETGARSGRVDFIVQSTDKNFMVPVGGAIVASSNADRIRALSCFYPGRASSVPITDLCITLLQMGYRGYDALRESRQQLLQYFKTRLNGIHSKHPGIQMLSTPGNGISIAIDISSIEHPSALGSSLYVRRCSGARVVVSHRVSEDGYKTVTAIGPLKFINFGSHCDDYPFDYLTVACAIGITREDIDIFIQRLDKLLSAKKNDSGLPQLTTSSSSIQVHEERGAGG